MGQSAPTVTQMMDRFQSRYAGFRAGLPRGEQRLFDRLVAEGHHHSTSLNSHPELDFERPLFLAMLLGTVQRLEVDQQQLRQGVLDVQERLEGVATESLARSLGGHRLDEKAASEALATQDS